MKYLYLFLFRGLFVLLLCYNPNLLFSQNQKKAFLKTAFEIEIVNVFKDTGLLLQLHLENRSEEAINIYNFDTPLNGIWVETPSQKRSFIGFISCTPLGVETIKVLPNENKIWEVDLRTRYFDPPMVIRPRERGVYRIYWKVNGVISEPYLYEYTGEFDDKNE